MQTLRWMRIPGDVLFAVGAAFVAWFVLGLLTGHSYQDSTSSLDAVLPSHEKPRHSSAVAAD